MSTALRQKTLRVWELRLPDFDVQSLRQCLNLLETSVDRYEDLKKSGASDVVLYTEKGLIARQLLFLSKVSVELRI